MPMQIFGGLKRCIMGFVQVMNCLLDYGTKNVLKRLLHVDSRLIFISFNHLYVLVANDAIA